MKPFFDGCNVCFHIPLVLTLLHIFLQKFVLLLTFSLFQFREIHDH
jgi:hypothetical protein